MSDIVNERDLRNEIAETKRLGRTTERLGEQLLSICTGATNALGDRLRPLDREEAISQAVLRCLRALPRIGPDWSENGILPYLWDIATNCGKNIDAHARVRRNHTARLRNESAPDRHFGRV